MNKLQKNKKFSIGTRYFLWLCKICKVDESLTKLFYHLHYNEYFSTEKVKRDLNREADARNLRQMFFGEEELPYDDFSSPISFLEFLVALAQRYSNIVDNPSNTKIDQWIKLFLHNCGLLKFNNVNFNSTKIDNIIYNINNRNYNYNGNGGLFPLKSASEDQRKIEIIEQMYNFINENGY